MTLAVMGLRGRAELGADASSGPAARVAAVEDPLVARLRAGDVAAIGPLYARHHAHVRAFARRLLGDEVAAEDLTHDVFVALPDALARFRGDATLGTLLCSIAVNLVRNHIRTAVRRRRALEKLGQLEAQRAPGEDPECTVEQQQLAEALTRALDTLPLEQRVAFVLCEVEERSALEAAQIVGAPEATVRTRVFHARRKLREWFARQEVATR